MKHGDFINRLLAYKRSSLIAAATTVVWDTWTDRVPKTAEKDIAIRIRRNSYGPQVAWLAAALGSESLGYKEPGPHDVDSLCHELLGVDENFNTKKETSESIVLKSSVWDSSSVH